MTSQPAGSGMMEQWWRLGGIAGIGWLVLFLIGVVAFQIDSPSRDDSIEDIRQYFTDDGDIYLAGDFIIAIGFVFFFLPFAVALSYLLRRTDGNPPILANLVVVAAVVVTLIGATASAFWGALAVGAAGNPEIDDSAVRLVMELDIYAFSALGFPAALLLAAGSLAIWRSGALWPWLAGLGGLSALLILIGSAWPIDGNEEGALAIVGFIGLIGFLVWVLAASVGMIMRQNAPDAG